MYATAEGTARYTAKHPQFRDAGFYRTVLGLRLSTLGIGTYLGAVDDAADRAYTEALLAAGEGGINFFDTAINYRQQRSERAIGAALRQLQRDEVVICTKAGFLTPGAVPDSLGAADVVGRMHSMAPLFLADQAARSRDNLRVDTIDVLYLHNPETQLGFVPKPEFYERIRRAFALLERLADEETIRWYGVATWDGLRKGALSLEKLAAIAAEEGGAEHRFRFVQLPFNLAMTEAFDGGAASILQTAARLGVAVVASASLLQTRVLGHMPESLAQALPGCESEAQRAIQFTRSTPGITVALVGMGRREHVEQNLKVARVPPATPQEYARLYQR
ncbi:MAG TPA: aldo/keto reductase [Bryobacteraceae bacterium]|nr:aldo/keto reductase [Bryobacteraceae bacterium]